MKPVDIQLLRSVEREKGIGFATVIDAMETALATAYKRSAGVDEARVEIDTVTGEVTVYAQEVDDDGNVLSEWVDEPHDFGRVAGQTAKQVLLQRLREAEREQTFGEYSGREGDLVTGTIQIHDQRVTVLDLGNAEAVLPVAEQVPTERYEHGRRLRALVVEVRRSVRGPQIIVSRTHPNLVRELFRLEVPEIAEGLVHIRAIAREAGYRTKTAVESSEPTVDPVGACVGARGGRVMAVVDELAGEKVDIVPWSDEPARLVANALSPAKVTEVYLYEDDHTALVIVPDYQLSLAIGREGQNARLAARLTGWRVDIKSETQWADEQAAFAAAYERGEIDEYGRPIPAAEEAAPAGEVAAPAGEVAAPAGEVAAPAGEVAAPAGEVAVEGASRPAG